MDCGEGPYRKEGRRLGRAEISGQHVQLEVLPVSLLSGRCQGPGLQGAISHFLSWIISTSKSQVSHTEFSCRPGRPRHRWEKQMAYSPLLSKHLSDSLWDW